MAKILVVEDEPELRETFVGELNDEGHITVEAGNGVEGLEKLAVETPDMIISDITMPEMNGYQFFRSVKEHHPEHAATPFLFLTALSDRADELKGLRLGVDDYLTKPVDFDLFIARVDAALRRAHLHVTAAAAAPADALDTEREKHPAVEKLGAIIEGNGGQVQTGKFKTISLDGVREKLGDRADDMWDRIVELAEAVIKDQLGAKDVMHMTPSRDILVCFADLSEDEADARVDQIRDLIWERLFAHTDDEELSHAEGQAFELSLDVGDEDDADVIFCEIEDLVDQKASLASEASQKKLLQFFQFEDLYALPLLTPEGVPSKIKMLSFETRHNDQVRKLFGNGRYEGPFLLEIHRALFERLVEKRTYKDAFSRTAMLLPIRFQVISDEETRDGLIQLCKDLERKMGVVLIIEMVDTPDRIRSSETALRPLPVGRQLHFLEIRRSTQLEAIEFGELNGLGVAFVSMSFDNVIRHDRQSLVQLTRSLAAKGVKFCIKEIPTGKLIEAQALKANLYAMRR